MQVHEDNHENKNDGIADIEPKFPIKQESKLNKETYETAAMGQIILLQG